ncbi:deoxynucleotide monophosphate kinase [Pseudomonas sp. WS 5059]|uniref:deoxynucleotide monophosphate kinase family protein n=1 Tax=Pseudomonas sp. WS 5059 TaxID=2717491 RepID=UPI0021CCC38D|nr:deoxynucleotide monophosphate kinase [Pseudomonas sp. WS 5059]
MRTIIGLAALARSGKDTVASMLLKHENVAAFALADPLKSGCQALFGLTSDEAWSDAIKEEVVDLWSLSPRLMFQMLGTEWMRHHNPEHWLMRADKQLNQPHIDLTPPPSDEYLSHSEAPLRLTAQAFFGFTNAQTWEPYEQGAVDQYWSITPNEAFKLIKNLTRQYFPNYEDVRAKRPVRPLETKQLSLEDKSVIIIKDIRYENEADFWRSHNGVIWHIQRKDALKVASHSSEEGVQHKPLDLLIENDGNLEDLQTKVDHAWLETMPRTVAVT